MESIDRYGGEVYYIWSTVTDPSIPSHLVSTLKTDLLKMMCVGTVLGVMTRFVVYKRHYMLKHYLKSSFYGSLFGLSYSPFFLSPKIDKYKLQQYL